MLKQPTVLTRSLPARSPLIRSVALAAAASFALVACGGDPATDDVAASSAPNDGSTEPGSVTERGNATEQGSATPRLALSYDGGVLVLDAASLKQVADLPVDGFTRLNSAENGRNVFVSESGGFRVLDMGTWTRQHGDHGHHYTTAPALTDMRFGGAEPGHVVPHASRITLFSDGTGEVNIVEPAELLRGNATSVGYTVPDPHHGVAVVRGDGSLVTTMGTEDERTTVAILDKDRKEITRTDQCPGVHGEAAAADGVLTFGCQNGIVIVRGNEIQKVASPDAAYGRIGNQAGSENSPVVFGDYKTDKDAELERPQRFTLTDTRTGTIRVVDIPTSYSFRSLERAENGDAVLLGTDGALYRFNVETGEQISRTPVINAWTEPDQWQSPMPNLHVQGTVAYVSDPASKSITAVDLATGQQKAKAQLPTETIELTGVTG